MCENRRKDKSQALAKHRFITAVAYCTISLYYCYILHRVYSSTTNTTLLLVFYGTTPVLLLYYTTTGVTTTTTTAAVTYCADLYWCALVHAILRTAAVDT